MHRRQSTLAGTGFDTYTKTTRRAQFLAEMNRVVRWRALCTQIDPVYPKASHSREQRVWDDSASTGQHAVLRACAPHARDFTQRKAGRHQPLSRAERATNRWKSRVRARVEHPLGVIKRIFGFTKVCYRGLAKNCHRLVVACALAELFMARKRLLRLQEA